VGVAISVHEGDTQVREQPQNLLVFRLKDVDPAVEGETVRCIGESHATCPRAGLIARGSGLERSAESRQTGP
jgi:hypothetical protein